MTLLDSYFITQVALFHRQVKFGQNADLKSKDKKTKVKHDGKNKIK